MGNQTSKKNARKSIKKDQINNMCSKLKKHLDISIKNKQAEINNKCKELIAMIRSPQRSKEAELNKMISISQEQNHVKALEQLQIYSETINSRSQAICSGIENQMEILQLVPMIEALGFSTNHANLQSLSEFKTFMKRYFGTKEYQQKIWESNTIDPEFKKLFEVLPKNQYSLDVNNLALMLCQQGLILNEINYIGHPFSLNPQQFYSNIGQSPYLSHQRSTLSLQSNQAQQYNSQLSAQQQFSQYNQYFTNQQQYQSNQQCSNQRQSDQNPQSKQDTNSFNQNIPFYLKSNPYSQNSSQSLSQQQSQRDLQQYNSNSQNHQSNQHQQLNSQQNLQQQNQQQFNQPQQSLSKQNSQQYNQYQISNQGSQTNISQQSANQQQPQVDQNGVPIIFPFNYSVSFQQEQNNQFGENFIQPYEQTYNSNHIGNKDDYQYPTESEFYSSKRNTQNSNNSFSQQQDIQLQIPHYDIKQVFSQQNNINQPSYIAIAKKFQSVNMFNNGQLPENFKYHNMLESKDIQFANQIYHQLDYIHPNGQDVKTIKERIENQKWNVDVATPQIQVKSNSNNSSQENSKISQESSKNSQETSCEDPPKRNSMKYPHLSNNSNFSNHEQQLYDIQNNIEKQNQILTQKQIECEIDSKLQKIQQELQIQNNQQNKGILTSSYNNYNIQDQYGQNSEVIYIQESLVIPFQTGNNSNYSMNSNFQQNNTHSNNNDIKQKDQHEIKSSFATQGETMDTNDILQDMNQDENHKNLSQILNEQLQQGKRYDNDCTDAYITNTIINEINKNRNTVNFNQHGYQFDSNISSTFRQ